MRRSIICAALLCGVVTLAVLGTRLKCAEHAAASLYEARFAAACEAMEELTLALDKLPLASPGGQQAQLLLSIARSGNAARTQLSALPLDQPASTAVATALGRLADQADALLLRLAAGAQPEESDLLALTEEQALCRRLCTQLMLTQEAILAQHLSLDPDSRTTLGRTRRADAQLALLSPAVCCEGAHEQAAPVIEHESPRGLPQTLVSQTEALQLAGAYVGADRVRHIQAAPDVSGVLPAYGAAVDTGDLRLHLEITRHGGKLLWMMPESASFPQKVSREDCRASIQSFLSRCGLRDLHEVAWQQYDGLYVATLAPMQDAVLLYPDVLHVQARMDTGEVVGFEADGYWTHHTARTLPEPRISAEEAASGISSRAKLIGSALCLLPTTHGETLCYQIHARMDEDDYLLFFSAEDGAQLAIRKLLVTSDGVQSA